MLPTKKQNNDFRKARFAVHSSGNPTPLQLKAWNVLYHHAYDELLTQELHEIPLRDLAETLHSHDLEYLKDALRAMTKCSVEWNILEADDGVEWTTTNLLAGATIRKDKCEYSFYQPLREKLANPKIYATINLSLQNRFKSSYEIKLFELCELVVDRDKGYGETDWIEIAKFKKLMGIKDEEYPVFKRLSQRAIREPKQKIENKTDLIIAPKFQREGRRVAAVKFIIQVKEEDILEGDQGEFFPELRDAPPVVRELIQVGKPHITQKDALIIWNKDFKFVKSKKRPDVGEYPNFETYLQEKVHYVKNYPKEVDKPGRLLLKAIKENYDNPAFKKLQQEQANQEIQTEIATLEQKKQQIQDEYQAKLYHL